jgi:hypothetical protein
MTRRHRFAQAFPIALNAYMKSTIRDNVIKAIGVLLEQSDLLSDLLEEQLLDIITKHPLRK